jgi:predicted transcriptional regulator
MKVIWDADRELSVQELMDLLQERYEKDYKRSTVMTFLVRLCDKEFIETQRRGKYAYIHALRSEEEYKAGVMEREVNFWYDGKISEMIDAMQKKQAISKEEAEKICKLLSE